MKAILTLLLLASIAANVMLLTGCGVSLETSRLYSPTNLLAPEIVKKFEDQLSDNPDQQQIFLKERDFLENHTDKIVIFLDNTETNRSAKVIRVRFTDGQ